MNLEVVERIICGELKTCIAAHGNITPNLIGSASKRISGGLKSYLTSLTLQQIVSFGEESLVTKYKRRASEAEKRVQQLLAGQVPAGSKP